MEQPNKNSPSLWLDTLSKLGKLLFQKISKLVDRILFNKKGSIVISLLVSIMICVGINYEDINLKLFNSSATTVELRDVSVETLADTDTYEISGVPSTVDVTLTGDAASIQAFRSKGSVQVVADLKKYAEGENVVTLYVRNLPNKVDADINPATVDVTLSKKVTKTFTVQPELLVGSGQKNSDFDTPTLNVETVKITASQNQINSIRIVKALIDCTGQISDFETTATLVAYDAKGNKVNVEISPENVQASVNLVKTSEDTTKEDS
jgi:YbbR domain-containing protein